MIVASAVLAVSPVCEAAAASASSSSAQPAAVQVISSAAPAPDVGRPISVSVADRISSFPGANGSYAEPVYASSWSVSLT